MFPLNSMIMEVPAVTNWAADGPAVCYVSFHEFPAQPGQCHCCLLVLERVNCAAQTYAVQRLILCSRWAR